MSGRNGFEWRGRFYPWHVSDVGKDLLLIDRIAEMPIGEFMEMVGDVEDTERAPVILGLIATSLRSAHPDWTVSKIERVVLAMSVRTDVEFVFDDDEDEAAVPPPSVPPPSEQPSGEQPGEPGKSPSSVSSLRSIPAEPSTSRTSSATQP